MSETKEKVYDFVIVHGSYGSPFENWFPWLFQQLESKGYNVLVPQFPCGIGFQNYENWFRVLDVYRPFFGAQTSFIGHSLGPAFITDYLLDTKLKVKGLYFVAPLYQKLHAPEFDLINEPFFIKNDFQEVANLSEKRMCFISENDPYVPNSVSLDFAQKIEAEIKMVQQAGHFNSAAGYNTFPQLLSEILDS